MSLTAEEFDMAINILSGMEESDAEHIVENLGFNDREKLCRAIRRHHTYEMLEPESKAIYGEED